NSADRPDSINVISRPQFESREILSVGTIHNEWSAATASHRLQNGLCTDCSGCAQEQEEQDEYLKQVSRRHGTNQMYGHFMGHHLTPFIGSRFVQPEAVSISPS